MTNKRTSNADQKRQSKLDSSQEQENRMRATEDEPAVDRGERIATGKAIARGGRSTGIVPGAQCPPRKNEKS